MNGFLSGILLAFEPARAADLSASYRVEIDGRAFQFAVGRGQLQAGEGSVAVTVTATAAQRKSALRRLKFDGDDDAVHTMQRVFELSS